MGIHHHHPGHEHHDHGARAAHDDDPAPRALTWTLGITAVFMGIEAVGGWWANSLALLSDAGHMLTDVGAVLLSLFALWFSRRPRTARMSYGYHRAEILGALTSGLMIWLLAGVLVFEAIQRFSAPPEVKGPVVTVIAALGLVANLVSMLLLRSAKEHNLNVKGAYLHMLADSLGSVGALVAGGVLWIWDWRPIDPITTVFFSVLMLVSSWELVKESVGVLMESSPARVDPEKIGADLGSIPGVREVHDLHVWAVASGRVALSVHLVAEETEAALKDAHDLLARNHGILHTTIQVEHPERFRSERCYDCAAE